MTDEVVERQALIGPAKPPEPVQSLFRPEVIASRQTQWLGAVLLEPRVSHNVFAACALVFLIATIGLMVGGSYTRKARINGWIVPQEGVIRVFAPQPGIVTQIQVREGDQVSKGAPLMTLSGELRTTGLAATRAEIVARLAERRDSLMADRGVHAAMFDQQAAELTSRLQALKVEQQHLAQESGLQRQRSLLANATLERMRLLRSKDLIPIPRLETAQQDSLDQAAKLQDLERQQVALLRDGQLVESNLRELPLKRKTQLAELARNVATVEQELAEAEARRQIVITAPQDGTVSGIQAEKGGNAGTMAPLLSIIPADSMLEAQLFSPSRAVGFIHSGQHVLIRFQPYPYQKFGVYDGTVASVSKAALSPSELPQQLAGLSVLYGANEPIYRITVTLSRQTVRAYGESVPLKPGMQLDADVLIDRRRLIEWVFDPLLSVTGSWRG